MYAQLNYSVLCSAVDEKNRITRTTKGEWEELKNDTNYIFLYQAARSNQGISDIAYTYYTPCIVVQFNLYMKSIV